MAVSDSALLETLQNAAAATGNGAAADLKGYRRLTVDVTISSFVGTVTFEGTIDDANWFSVGLRTAADGAAATTATAAGTFKLPDDGPTLSQFRARVSAYTSGTVTVKSRKDAR